MYYIWFIESSKSIYLYLKNLSSTGSVKIFTIGIENISIPNSICIIKIISMIKNIISSDNKIIKIACKNVPKFTTYFYIIIFIK